VKGEKPMYDGEIKPGMRFLWEPRNSRAWADIEVTRIREGTIEPIVFAVVHDGAGERGMEYVNHMSRFREAVEIKHIKHSK
jgi:hypothetical protein